MDEEKRQWIAEERAKRVGSIKEALHAFLGGSKAFTLEIGCGHGRWLSRYAESHPDEKCVGIDLITKRIEMGMAKKEKRSIDNLTFIKAECGEFLEAVSISPELQIARCFMLFPDPWPKKRHHKKRMVQTAFLSELEQLMPEGGWFCFRTDHEDYFAWTEEHVSEHSAWVQSDSAVNWPFENSSFFQDLLPEYQSLIAVKKGS